jgi:hypothetical protein
MDIEGTATLPAVSTGIGLPLLTAVSEGTRTQEIGILLRNKYLDAIRSECSSANTAIQRAVGLGESRSEGITYQVEVSSPSFFTAPKEIVLPSSCLSIPIK